MFIPEKTQPLLRQRLGAPEIRRPTTWRLPRELIVLASRIHCSPRDNDAVGHQHP